MRRNDDNDNARPIRFIRMHLHPGILLRMEGGKGDVMNLELNLQMYAEMKAELQPALDLLKALEKEIKAHVLESGEVAEVDGASVSIRNGYTRTSWDGKALTGYAAAHPEIEQFCKRSEIKPSAVIKVMK